MTHLLVILPTLYYNLKIFHSLDITYKIEPIDDATIVSYIMYGMKHETYHNDNTNDNFFSKV